MTLASAIRTRPTRAVAAFLMMLGALVVTSSDTVADAASDDISVNISGDQSAILPGIVTSWTVVVETTVDAVSATGIVVTDTIPDGLCLQGVGDGDCPGGTAPSPLPATVTENSDGTWTVVWNLADMGTAEQASITYTTLTRTNYQESGVDDTPVLARDSWLNWAHLDAVVDGQPASDDSTTGQSAPSPTVAKDVAERPAALVQPAVCDDGSTMSWNGGNATGYRMGDQACWRLTVNYPAGLVTAGSTIKDNLPSGQMFTASDTWAPGAGNTVPVGQIDGSAIGAGDTSLDWGIGDASGYVSGGAVLELVYSSTIVDPEATASGQIVTGSMGHTITNTAGQVFNTSDSAGTGVDEPEVDLEKGVTAINGVPTGGSIDGATVKEADAIAYELTITNSGDVDANDIEVWDLLPAEYATCSARVGAIGDGGMCSDADNRIEWTGPAVFSVPAGSSVTRSYVVTFPTAIAPGESLSNDAGIRSYTSATNNGSGLFSYIPASNIDPAVGTTNTAAANDSSYVVTDPPTIGITRVTSIDEAGNAAYQATIGEQVTYTVTVVIPEGSTVYDAALADDLPANLDLISASPSFDGEQPVTITEDAATDTVTIEFPDPSYTNGAGTGIDTLSVTIVAQVLDIPVNARNTPVANTANFAWYSHEGVAREIGAVVSTTIVEPLIGINKSSVDSIGDDGMVVGNETVDYTLTVTNSGTTNVSTAHDAVIVDTLPEGMTLSLPVADSGVWTPDATPGDGIGGTITWTVASLAPVASVSRTYEVTIDNPVTVSTTFTNNVAVDVSSRAGTPAVERTAGTGYHAEGQHTLNAPLASIAKSVVPTTATIGDIVTYTIDVTIPPGTIMYDATVIDTLPAGVGFDAMISSSCVMGGSACNPDIVATEVVGTPDATFYLGDIDVPSATGEDRVVTITYAGHLLDTGSAGDARVNAASIYGNRTDLISGVPATEPDPATFDVAVGPTIATVTVTEPSLSIDKDVAGQAGDSDYRRAVPGESLSYTIQVANSGAAHTSAAYDITIVDTVPEGVTVSLPIADGGVWTPDAVPGDGVGGMITWMIPGPLAAGASVSRTYDVTIDAGLNASSENPGASELVGAADVPSYYGVAEAGRLANPGFVYRNYDDVAADEVSVELDLASIGDYVWFDINADGFQDPGEPPLANIDVTVTYRGADGVPSGDDEVHVATTGPDGAYLVEHLPGGQYTVVIDTADLPPGFAASYDLDDGTLAPDDMWGPGPLAENEDKLGADFGYTGTGSIDASVWFDIDKDGAIDGDEYGLESVAVAVTWAGFDGAAGGDDIVYNLTTDAAGSYSVSHLPAGDYTVDVDPLSLPTGMQPTVDADGIGTANSSVLTLAAGEDNLLQNFGYAGTGAIGDRVWLDADGDGLLDPDEFGLAGVPVQLVWPGEDGVSLGGDDEIFLTSTDADGLYLFENLPPGEYQVAILGGLPLAATNTHDPDGGGDSMAGLSLSDSEVQLGIDFGYQGTTSVGDIVWWDQNGNGALDSSEPGIEGVELVLTYAGEDGVIGTLDDLPLITYTDATGSYAFTDLPAGYYQVEVSSGQPAGMVPTHDEDGGLDEIAVVGLLGVGEFHLGADFGYNGTGSVGDFVWLDLNADGVQDLIEPGIPGVDIDLSWHGVDGIDGTADDVVLTAPTDIDGSYTLADLPAGGYTAAVDPATLPLGVIPTYDPDGLGSVHTSQFSLGDGEARIDQDFGYNGGGSIGDSVWFDRNGDGEFGSDEYGIGGVTVTIIWAGPDLVLGTADDESCVLTTGAPGDYLETQLPPGEYAVLVDPATLPAGMVPTNDEDGTLDDQTIVVLGDGEVHRTTDFGYRGAGEIGDLVWFDVDGDAVDDPDEPGIPGQTVQLDAAGTDGVLGTGDDQTYLTSSAADGEFLFANLPPGEYVVSVTGAIASAAANTWDEDGGLDSRVDLVLGDEEIHRTTDFGYRGSAEIGGSVWHDLDGDGERSQSEPGITGVEMTVTWYGDDGVYGGGDDTVLPPTQTSSSGQFLVPGLPAGSYGVAVSGSVPDGLTNSADPDDDLDGRTDVAGLASGASYTGADFGYAGGGSIGDQLWWDLDGDGFQSADEPGLAGVTLTLTWAGFDGLSATGDDAGFVTTTTPDGSYVFENLAPGNYDLEVDAGDLPPDVGQATDPDGVIDNRTGIMLAAAEVNLGQDFGYRGHSSVGDLVWYDIDRNGVADSAEPGVADVPITVTYTGADGTGSTNVAFATTTAADGTYAVDGLPSGFYEVNVASDGLGDGLVLSSDADGGDAAVTSLVVGSSQTVSDVDFAVVGSGALQGMVWNDRDGDGGIDPAEVGIAGVGVVVTWLEADGKPTVVTATDAFGNWEVPELPDGEYDVEIDATTAPIGMTTTTDVSQSVALAPSGTDLVNFGLALLLDVGSGVWFDSDGDGVFDPDEVGIGHVLVNLCDETGLLVGFTETDGEGGYRFIDLLPGIYTVQLDSDSLPQGAIPSWDRDGSPDLTTLLDLTTGEDILDAGFGFQTGLPMTGIAADQIALWGAALTLLGLLLVAFAGVLRRVETKLPGKH
jgi:fimbrial isopeptide formation D2 family protein/uncharacterized repeat protein (TIGR01451 family)